MGVCKKPFCVMSIELAKWLKDIRVKFVFVFTAYLVFYFIRPITLYGLETGYKSTPWLMTLMFSSGDFAQGLPKIYFHVGMMVLLCDAPFFRPVTPYMVLRSRRGGWWAGECLYIIAAALIYTLFITLMTALMTLPVMTLQNDWGDVIEKHVYLETSDSSYPYISTFHIEATIVKNLYPQGAMIYEFAAVWCSFSFVGLITYFVSLATHSSLAGVGAAGFFVFADPLLASLSTTYLGKWMVILSPTCWTSMELLTCVNRFYKVSIEMAMGLYAVLIMGLCAAIARCSKRAVIEAGKPF